MVINLYIDTRPPTPPGADPGFMKGGSGVQGGGGVLILPLFFLNIPMKIIWSQRGFASVHCCLAKLLLGKG